MLFRTGELDCKFYSFASRRIRPDVSSILVGCEDLVEQIAELHLAPSAASLDICKYTSEIANATSERLHFAQALVNLLQAVAYDA